MGNLASQYPKMKGGSPDLSKTDANTKNIISHFKSSTGSELHSLKGEQFLQVIKALVIGGDLFKKSVVAPTQDGFRQMIPETPPEIADVVYMYYYKKNDSVASVAASGGQSWWESLFGGGATTSTDSKSVDALLASVQPAAGTATTPAGAVGGATVQPVTAANPAPGWGSYASNLTNSATDALIAQGNANAGIPAPTVPPVVPPAA